MRSVVFVGPTVSRKEASEHFAAIYLPPAAQGDVYLVAKERPFAIGVIDGYFERLPAIWHKEILWALAQGIHVFGASSMGALRAAELTAFGMKGVGAIYEALVSGAIEDDDEVAVAHADAAAGYRAVSEAMVNIRATLESAERRGVVGARDAEALVAIAKGLFYPDRSYPLILSLARDKGVPEHVIDSLRIFIKTGRVDQKRLDAFALLDAVQEIQRIGAPPAPVSFAFARTEAWDRALDWAETQPSLLEGAEGVPADLVAAEARLTSGSVGLVAAGLNRVVAGLLARREGLQDRRSRVEVADRRLREVHGPSEQAFGRWLESQGLTRETYDEYLERNVELEWLRDRHSDEVDRHIVDELRTAGTYEALSARARHKASTLREQGLADPVLDDAGMARDELLAWYFERRLGRAVPSEMSSALAEMGIADPATLQREALREFLYSRITSSEH